MLYEYQSAVSLNILSKLYKLNWCTLTPANIFLEKTALSMLHGELTGTRFCNERSIRAKLMCDSFQMKLISESKNII